MKVMAEFEAHEYVDLYLASNKLKEVEEDNKKLLELLAMAETNLKVMNDMIKSFLVKSYNGTDIYANTDNKEALLYFIDLLGDEK